LLHLVGCLILYYIILFVVYNILYYLLSILYYIILFHYIFLRLAKQSQFIPYRMSCIL